MMVLLLCCRCRLPARTVVVGQLHGVAFLERRWILKERDSNEAMLDVLNRILSDKMNETYNW